ncbi:hypothetical protein BP422_00985 [Brevibacillus formosus]|uniref:Uncharacterized protein n=1 Tax=Brevibacillus formosus TaxID=54913 RepID=A0A220MB57_9BACL|nr:hypothetical protein [Brevibacillus formosus]ASJ52232.1 hypothetical protein BP422_00985 [Brevibacillus formosus]
MRKCSTKFFDQLLLVLFSAVMRDVDLAVSIAHIGGADPEASLTIMKMHRVIVKGITVEARKRSCGV